ncbi:hypothetical protein ASG99_23040 [Bacillus sp. Soil768D1]|nr:hypothetical protein ASG99_23040 [Bacillus sp. Soil768D1]
MERKVRDSCGKSECLEWKSTFEFLQPLKKTVDKLDFHQVCLQSDQSDMSLWFFFVNFEKLILI